MDSSKCVPLSKMIDDIIQFFMENPGSVTTMGLIISGFLLLCYLHRNHPNSSYSKFLSTVYLIAFGFTLVGCVAYAIMVGLYNRLKKWKSNETELQLIESKETSMNTDEEEDPAEL
ncbi:unnamed protein product [Auanema sp. JU1783]|nr:unnamed protein product [Auanema sp. JU1783]